MPTRQPVPFVPMPTEQSIGMKRKRKRVAPLNVAPKNYAREISHRQLSAHQKTVYDDLREQLGVARFSIDSSQYAPLEVCKKERAQKLGGRSSLFETRLGFEVSRNRDPRQMQFLKFCRSAPRGWCRKYWWDVEPPIQWIEAGGRTMVYTEKHQKLVDQANGILHLSLKAEEQLHPVEGLQLCYKHQIFRKVGTYSLAEPYLFSNDNPQYPPTEYSDQRISKKAPLPVTGAPSERRRQARLLPPHSRHRLFDSRLLNELTQQQQLRDACLSSQQGIDDTLKQWEDVEGVWIQRTDGIPLSQMCV